MRNLLMTISIFLLSLVVSGQNLKLDVDKQYMLTPEKGISKNLVDAFFEFYDIPVIQYFDKLNTYVVKVEDVQEFMAACDFGTPIFDFVAVGRGDWQTQSAGGACKKQAVKKLMPDLITYIL
jgi:hypothetical protein